MAPQYLQSLTQLVSRDGPTREGLDWRQAATREDLVIESWSEGFIVGAIVIMAALTIANMRRGILLHKLILLEQLMAVTHGTFCFMDFKGYGWYLSSTAALLYLSYILHNVVAWMKIRPFFYGRSSVFTPRFAKWTQRIYVWTLACTVPPMLFQISDNFRYFNDLGGWYPEIRPYEALMRDPWWIFCSAVLFYVISRTYGMNVRRIVKKSPRFGILFLAIVLSVIFTTCDISASIVPTMVGSTLGINPFWKLSLVFKLLTDAILLDDFKTELRRLGLKRLERDEKRRGSVALTLDDSDIRYDSDENAERNFSSPSLGRSRTAVTNHQQNQDVNSFDHAFQQYKARRTSNLNGHPNNMDFMDALNDEKIEDASSSRSSHSSQGRGQVGQGGVKARTLPTFFESIRPGGGQKKNSLAKTSSKNSDRIDDQPNKDKDNVAEPELDPLSRPTSIGVPTLPIRQSAPRLEDKGPSMPASRLPSREGSYAKDRPHEDGALEQARRMHAATVRALQIEQFKSSTEPQITKTTSDVRSEDRLNGSRIERFKRGGSDDLLMLTPLPADMRKTSTASECLSTSSQRKQSKARSSVDEGSSSSSHGKRKREHGKPREWWDQFEEDLDYLNSVDDPKQVEELPSSRKNSQAVD